MTLKSRFLPWQPKLVFSGYSYYTIDIVYGKITGQRDVWDAIQDNSTGSVRGRCKLYVCIHLCPPASVLLACKSASLLRNDDCDQATCQ